MNLLEEAPEIVREPSIAPHVVFVDGLYGCGKTLVSAVVGTLERVEVEKYNYPIEYACGLNYLGKLTDDAATVQIRLLTDIDIYNLMMSRETNFRFSDLSSIWRHPLKWDYVRRLWQPGDQMALERVKNKEPILNMVSHVLFPISRPLFKGLGDRLSFIEVIRHPLYMVKQWMTFMDRLGKDPREFTLWFDHKGQAMPWWVRGIEDRYLNSSLADRLVFSMQNLLRLGEHRFDTMSETEKERLLVIPFEQFVLDPLPYLKKLEKLLGAESTSKTRRELKKQNLPRKRIADGIPLPIYKLCGWEPSSEKNERSELKKRRDYILPKLSTDALDTLDEISAGYENRYMRGLI